MLSAYPESRSTTDATGISLLRQYDQVYQLGIDAQSGADPEEESPASAGSLIYAIHVTVYLDASSVDY